MNDDRAPQLKRNVRPLISEIDMTRTRQKPWLERGQIPDPQVRDAAEQYNSARRLFNQQPPQAGVLLPLLNAAIVALELYLKSLASERVHQFWSFFPAFWTVHAEPKVRSHRLVDVFDAIPDDMRALLEQQFGKAGFEFSKTLRGALERYEGLFAISRYPFEINVNLREYQLGPLNQLVDFVAAFVADLPSTDRITWPKDR